MVKRIYKLLVIFLSVLFLFSCNDDIVYTDDIPNPPIDNPPDDKANDTGHLVINEAKDLERIGISPVFSYRESQDGNSYYRNRGVSKIKMYDGYIYYYSGKTINHYNPVTNVKTILCADPLCSHETEGCSFYGYDAGGAFSVYENTALYWRDFPYMNSEGGLSFERSVALYDMEDQSVSVLRHIEGNINLLGSDICIGNQYIYTTVERIENKENGTYTNVYRLILKNLKTGDEQVLVEEQGILRYLPLYAYNGQVFIRDTVEDVLYVAPQEDFTDMRPIARAYGNAMVHVENMNVFSLDPDAGGKIYYSASPDELIEVPGIEGAEYFYVTDQYIYYGKQYDAIESMAFYGEPVTTFLREYYRCDHHGQNHELVYREEPKKGEFTQFMGDFVVIGDYIYTTKGGIAMLLPGDDGEIHEVSIKSTIQRYDIKTGEWYYVMNE